MASTTRAAVPSPNFNTSFDKFNSVFRKSNLWTNVLQERAHPNAKRKHNLDDGLSSPQFGVPPDTHSQLQLESPSRLETEPRSNSRAPSTTFNLWTSKNHFKSEYRYAGQHNSNSDPLTKKLKREVGNEYYCDACDRAFKNAEQYDLHISEHEKCRVEDCNYVAAPKLVKLHYNMQHLTGLAKKIKESSQDIQKWLEERRRNYPTAENIERKRQELREKVERGEILETPQFGKMGRGRGKWRGRGGNRNAMSRRDNHSWVSSNLPDSPTVARPDPLSTPAESHTALESQRIFHTNKQTFDSQPDDGILATAASSVGAVTGTPSALGSLMSSYGDISSGEEEGEIVEPSHPMPVQSTEKQKSDQKTEKTSPLAQITGTAGECDNPESGNHKQKRCQRSRKRRGKTPKNSVDMQRQQQQRTFSKCKSTLLEKLLAGEMRHERNVLLQCVRYVIQQEFFGAGVQKVVVPSMSSNDDMWEQSSL